MPFDELFRSMWSNWFCCVNKDTVSWLLLHIFIYLNGTIHAFKTQAMLQVEWITSDRLSVTEEVQTLYLFYYDVFCAIVHLYADDIV